MNRYAYVTLFLLALLTLSACGDAERNVGQGVAETGVSGERISAPESQGTETPAEAEPSQEPEPPAGAEELQEEEKPAEAEPSQEAQARELTEQELRQWSEFLSQSDCYGFLMSDYATPLEADLGQVFYSGAGVGEYPTEEMVADFLEETGLEEAYTDITFVPYDAANQVLQRRTGYALEHFKLAGNDIPMTYLQKYAGYFQMAGDTNAMAVECVSGRLNPDGSVILESREKSWSDEPDDDFTSTFETTLRPDAQGREMVFASNVITGGWLSWTFDEDEIE